MTELEDRLSALLHAAVPPQPDAISATEIVDRLVSQPGRGPARNWWVPALAAMTVAVIAAAVSVFALIHLTRQSHGEAPAGTPAPASQSTSASLPAPTTPDTASSTSLVADLGLPIMKYLASPQLRNFTSRAEAKVAQDCLSRYGIQFVVPTPSGVAPDPFARVYGISDSAVAAKYGYHLAPNATAVTSTSSSLSELSPEQIIVLTGASADQPGRPLANPGAYNGKEIPVGGCYGEGRRQITGVDTIDPMNIATNILNAANQQARRDPRVTAAFATWSECMAQSGYHYSSPIAAMGDAAAWGQASAPTATEIATATADVACKISTNLIPVWASTESGFEATAIAQHQSELDGILRQWNTAANAASKELGQPIPQTN